MQEEVQGSVTFQAAVAGEEGRVLQRSERLATTWVSRGERR